MGAQTRTLSAFLLALALLLGGRALLAGAGLADVAAFELFTLLWIILPGCALYARWREPEEDGLAFFGMGCSAGYALQALGYPLLKLLGIPGAFAFWPLLALPWAWQLLRRRPDPAAVAGARLPGAGQLVLLLLVLLFALGRCELQPGSSWFTRAVADPLFHLGNAAELRAHWPLVDPRVATLPLNYHFLGYSASAGANQVFGTSLPELMLRTGALLAPLVCVLQVWNCGRGYWGRASAGLAAALLVVVGTNLSSAVELLSSGTSELFNASRSLDTNLYISRTSPAGLMLFASLMLLVRREFARGGTLLPAALLACALSGLKGSCGPVVLGGLALDALVRWLRGDESRGRALRQFLALGAATSVFVLWLTTGSGSYASSIFRFSPLFALQSSGMYLRATRELGWERGAGPLWFDLALLLPWIALALGPSLAGGIVALARGGRDFLFEHLWLWGTLLGGLALGLGLGASGNNELAFLHPGQIALAVLAAGSFTSFGPRLRTALLLYLVALPFLIGGAARLCDNLATERREFAAATSEGPELRALHWLRENSRPDALVVLDSTALCVSAFAERRAFHESTVYTPATYALRWVEGEGGLSLRGPPSTIEIDKQRLRERVIAGEAQALAELRAQVPGSGRIYLLFEAGKAPDEAALATHAERVFHNDAFEFWLLKE
jgi:hypothetical protein